MTAHEITKIGLNEKLTRVPKIVFAKVTRSENIPIYGISLLSYMLHASFFVCLSFYCLP